MPLNSKRMCSAQLGPTCYFSEIINQEHIVIEAFENYAKQTIRNRCYILGTNGPQLLNIPMQKVSGKQLIKDIKISYAEDWQKLHWKSIQTAYGSSAFFEVLAPELEPFYFNTHNYLLDLNLELTELKPEKSFVLNLNLKSFSIESIGVKSVLFDRVVFS